MDDVQKVTDRSLFAVSMCCIDRITQRMQYLRKTGRLSESDWDFLNEAIEDMKCEVRYIQSEEDGSEIIKYTSDLFEDSRNKGEKKGKQWKKMNLK